MFSDQQTSSAQARFSSQTQNQQTRLWTTASIIFFYAETPAMEPFEFFLNLNLLSGYKKKHLIKHPPPHFLAILFGIIFDTIRSES